MIEATYVVVLFCGFVIAVYCITQLLAKCACDLVAWWISRRNRER